VSWLVPAVFTRVRATNALLRQHHLARYYASSLAQILSLETFGTFDVPHACEALSHQGFNAVSTKPLTAKRCLRQQRTVSQKLRLKMPRVAGANWQRY